MSVCLNALLDIFFRSTSHLAGRSLMTLESAGLTLGLHSHTPRFYQGATHHHLTGSHGEADVNNMAHDTRQFVGHHTTQGCIT